MADVGEDKHKHSLDELDTELLRLTNNYSNLPKSENRLDDNLQRARDQFLESEQFKAFVEIITDAVNLYEAAINDNLLPDDEIEKFPDRIETKPYDSVVDKIYRTNFVINRQAEKGNPPHVYTAYSDWTQAWVTGDNYELYINDLIRGRIIVKTVDAIPFLKRHIDHHTAAQKYAFNTVLLNKIQGYYALHVYVPFSYTRADGTQVVMLAEFQVHTQLRSFLSSITHKLYQARRSYEHESKYDYFRWGNEDKFLSSSLGHMLQFIEVAMVRIRDGRQE